jgi:hypothetical protein
MFLPVPLSFVIQRRGAMAEQPRPQLRLPA